MKIHEDRYPNYDVAVITGRMITPDLAAHNSTRNTVACMVHGQAAGTVAALAVKSGLAPADVDVEQLQTNLSNQKALLKPVPDPL